MMRGLEELRVKESDRVAAVETGLAACGADVASGPDWLRVRGEGALESGGKIKTHHDHRMAMSFLVAGLAGKEPIEIDDTSMIATSFPSFLETMRKIGARIENP